MSDVNFPMISMTISHAGVILEPSDKEKFCDIFRISGRSFGPNLGFPYTCMHSIHFHYSLCSRWGEVNQLRETFSPRPPSRMIPGHGYLVLDQRGWLGAAKVCGILRQRGWGVQLILGSSSAVLAIRVADKVEGKCFYFFCFFTFISVPLSSLSLSFISSAITFLAFSGRQHKMTYKSWPVLNPSTINLDKRQNQVFFLFFFPQEDVVGTSNVYGT